MRSKLIIVLSFTCSLATIALVAQEIPSDELFWGSRPYVPEVAGTSAIRVQSDLVEVPTTVRDGHGNPVGDLKKEDFLLFDNGKLQTISTFSVLTGTADSMPGNVSDAAPLAQPRYVALFFDDVNTSFSNLNFARDGAIKFIRKGLDPGERVGVFTASGALSLDFTDDAQKLLDTLAKLRLFQRPAIWRATLSPGRAWPLRVRVYRRCACPWRAGREGIRPRDRVDWPLRGLSPGQFALDPLRPVQRLRPLPPYRRFVLIGRTPPGKGTRPGELREECALPTSWRRRVKPKTLRVNEWIENEMRREISRYASQPPKTA